MTLLSLTLALFLIMDPLGNINGFISTLEGIEPNRQRYLIIREMAFALVAMLFFNFVGEYIFNLLKISETTVYISSSIILFLGAIKILFPNPLAKESKKLPGEPFLVPLAIPMIAGPALLATIMLYAKTEPSPVIMLTAILIAWALTSIILLSSKQLVKLLRPGGLIACEKLMGMILILLSIDRFLQGVVIFTQQQ